MLHTLHGLVYIVDEIVDNIYSKQMERITTTLTQLGFSKNAVALIVALLRIKRGTVTQITEEAHIPRTTAYSILSELSQKGLVVEEKKGPRAVWAIVSPAKFYEEINSSTQQLKTILPEMRELFGAAEAEEKLPARISSYRGKKAVLNLYEQILDLSKGERVFVIQGGSGVEKLFDHLTLATIEDWQGRFKKKGIVMEALVNQHVVDLLLRSRKEVLRAHADRSIITWVVPKTFFDVAADLYVFRDKLILIDLARETGATIESRELSAMYRQLFAIAKMSAKQIDLNALIKKKLGE